MEKLIIIGLLITIILILLDRRFTVNVCAKDSNKNKKSPPSIMGATKQRKRQDFPIEAFESHLESTLLTEYNFDSETRNGKAADVIQNKNLDDILITDDWEQEEDWKYQDSNVESGFASGVTVQELRIAGQLVQMEMLDPDLEQQAVAQFHKTQGTELLDRLENALGDASKRIANLLNQSTSNDSVGISFSNIDGVEGFDIGKFL